MDSNNDDIYYSKQRLEYWKRRIIEDHSANGNNNADTALKFTDALKVYGIANSRLKNYALYTHRILEIKNDTSMKEWTRKDVDHIVSKMLDRKWENETRRMFIITLKRLAHYAKCNEIAEKKDGRDYCEEVKHLNPSFYREKVEKIKPSDLITQNEFLSMIDSVQKISRHQERDVAAFYVEKGFAGRPGEFFNMRTGGVMFKDQYCVITSYGKTGQKTLALVTEYRALLEWLQKHPERDNPDAYLWYADNRYGRITYNYFRELVKRAAREAGIRKRVWLYLFRHTALTEIEREFGSAITNIYGNWTKGSKARERYIHLASSDQEKALLKKYGLLKEDDEQSLLKPKLCPRCDEQNSPDKKRCVKCGFILDTKLALKYASREQLTVNTLVKRMKRVEEEWKEREKEFEDMLQKARVVSGA